LQNKKGGGMLLMQEMLVNQKKSQEFYEDPLASRVLQFKENEHFRKLFAGRMAYFSVPAVEKRISYPHILFFCVCVLGWDRCRQARRHPALPHQGSGCYALGGCSASRAGAIVMKD